LLTPAAAAEPPPLSLHDALPISRTIATTSALRRGGVRPSACRLRPWHGRRPELRRPELLPRGRRLHSLRRRGLGDRPWLRAKHPDRKSTRLNSSHAKSSYSVFCL